MNHKTKELNITISELRHYEKEVSFEVSINGVLQTVYGRYIIQSNIFYPDLIEIWGLQQFADDNGFDEDQLFEKLQQLYEERDR